MITITTSDLDEVTVPEDPIAHVSGARINGADQNRWHDLTLYLTDDALICHIEYCSNWEKEIDHDLLVRATDLDDLRRQLRDHVRSPLAYVRGFPPLPQYAQRQENLLQWLRGRFGAVGKDLITEARAYLSPEA
jgi:hypothetical protein